MATKEKQNNNTDIVFENDEDFLNENFNYYHDMTLFVSLIKEQIEELETPFKEDQIAIFDEKYNQMKVYYSGTEKTDSRTEEFLSNLESVRGDFYQKVFNLLTSKFRIYPIFRESALNEEVYTIIHAMYKFFVINWYENVKRYYINLLISEKESIIQEYDGRQINLNDIMYTLIKNELKDKKNSLIVFIANKYYKDMNVNEGYIEDILLDMIRDEESEYINSVINYSIIEMNDLADISVNIREFKLLIKHTLETSHSIIMEVQQELITRFKSKK